MENKKIEKGKSYTYEELKEIYESAITHTLVEPTGGKDKDAKFQFSLMLSGMIILHTLKDNLFEKESNLVEFKNDKEV